jgi:hypothetical protein
MREFMNIGDTEGKSLPKLIKMVIDEQLDILDGEYGADRDQFSSDGGYVVIVESEEDLREIESRHGVYINGEEEPSIAEYVEELVIESKSYLQMLFLLSNDYGLVVIIEKDKLPDDSVFIQDIERVIKDGDDGSNATT